METYIYTVKKGRTDSVVTSVYRVKRNEPEYIGEIKYQTGSYKGHSSEVLRFLFCKKLTTDIAYNASNNSWRGFGYYDRYIHPKLFGLQIIEL